MAIDRTEIVTPWDLKEGESFVLVTEGRGSRGVSIPFTVTRVPNGWIYSPMTPNVPPVFVPLTTYSNPNI